MNSQTISQSERDRLTTNLKETRERLLLIVRSLSPEQLDYKPAANRWSVAENIEHVTKVEGLILQRITNTLQGPSGSFNPSGWQDRDDEVVALVLNRSNRFKGPDAVQPTGQWRHDELFPEFEQARRRTHEFAATTNADLRRSTFRHPIFGELDCYQWLLMLSAHSDRHRAQIEEVMATADFPRAAAHA
ncbi:MAG: DinB family protein [Candidatus Acidiferrales bacterium]